MKLSVPVHKKREGKKRWLVWNITTIWFMSIAVPPGYFKTFLSTCHKYITSIVHNKNSGIQKTAGFNLTTFQEEWTIVSVSWCLFIIPFIFSPLFSLLIEKDSHQTDQPDYFCQRQQREKLLQGSVQTAQVLCWQKLLERLESPGLWSESPGLPPREPSCRLDITAHFKVWFSKIT